MLSSLAPTLHRVKFLLNDHSSTILTGVGVGGTVATAYLTGRASFKAARIIDREQEAVYAEWREEGSGREPIELTKKDKAKLVWKQYIPPVSAGLVTVAAVVAANRVSSRKIAALVVASGISERALTEYKEKVIERLGPRQDEKIRDEIAQDRVTNNPPVTSQVHIMGTGQVLCFDMTTGRYFTSTMEQIRAAENTVNREIIHFNYCSLSHFYDEIGLEPTHYTDTVGWNLNNHIEVQFSTVLSKDNQPCLAINFTRQPLHDYDKTWG